MSSIEETVITFLTNSNATTIETAVNGVDIAKYVLTNTNTHKRITDILRILIDMSNKNQILRDTSVTYSNWYLP